MISATYIVEISIAVLLRVWLFRSVATGYTTAPCSTSGELRISLRIYRATPAELNAAEHAARHTAPGAIRGRSCIKRLFIPM